MGHGSGIREVAWFDIAGGGQVVLDGNHAYIGHMDPPHGTSVLNVADPAHPRLVASIAIPPGLHSHKVRVANEVMVVNRERARGEKPADDFVGLRIFDVSSPASPRDICHWECAGMGVHRFTFDGRYAYISAELEGYIGTIVMILDLKDPTRPEEVGRWWMEGQWTAGGETPGWKGRNHRCHHPIRRGDRLYVSYWYGGGVILDISDMTKPRMISSLDWSSAVRLAHPQLGADRRADRRPSLDAGSGRACPTPRSRSLTGTTGDALDGEHHRRDAPDPGELLPTARTGRSQNAVDDSVPPTGRNDHWQRSAGGLVRQRAESDRYLQSALNEASRLVDAGRTGRRAARMQQRRLCRSSWPDLPDRPQQGIIDPRARLDAAV